MSWTLCTSGAAIYKAGANVSSSVISGAILADWSNKAEAYINAATGYDWTTNYASLQTNYKYILDDLCASIIARNMINYDMSGYTSRQEATTMLDVLTDTINIQTAVLKDTDKTGKIKNGS